MMRSSFPLALLAALVLATASCGRRDGAEAAAQATAAVAAPTAAAAEAAQSAGSVTQLSGYDFAANAGKVVFVELWGVWCPPCIRSMPHVQETWDHYKANDDFRLMVVNTGWRGDNPDRVRGWLKQNSRYSFPVFFDDRPQAQQYAALHEVTSIPRSIIFDKRGQVRYNGHPMQIPAGLLDELLAETI